MNRSLFFRSLFLLPVWLLTAVSLYAQGLQLQVINQNSALCPGEPTGKFTVRASGGTAPYRFSVNGGLSYQAGNAQNEMMYQNLWSGTHRVMVRDENGARTFVSVELTQAPYITASATGTNVSQCNAYDGSLTVTASGGTPPYQYRLSGQSWYSANNVFTGLGAGSYWVEVRDVNGCTSYAYQYIAVPVILDASIASQTDPTGTCSNDGTVTVQPPTNGSGSYMYIYRGMMQGNNVFSGLRNGYHVITVYDQNWGCRQELYVYLDQINPITGNVSVTTTPVCPNEATGAVTITASGGTPPYQYQISGGSLSNNNSFTGLRSNSHAYLIVDANGCTFSSGFWLGYTGNGMTLTATHTDSDCMQNNGTITATVSGGTPPYKYRLNNGAVSNQNTFNGLAVNYYTVEVEDAGGCTAYTYVNVKNPIRMTVDTLKVPTCYGRDGDGKIRVNASGLPGPFEYSIDAGQNWQPGNEFDNLGLGNSYQIRTRDISGGSNNGCTAEQFFQFRQPFGEMSWEMMRRSYADTVQPKCDGTPGKVTIYARPLGFNYEYSVNGIQWSTDSVFNNLESGIDYRPQIRLKPCNMQDYSYQTYVSLRGTVQDSIWWRRDSTFRFPDLLSRAELTLQATSGCGAADGQITVNATGRAPFEYRINGGAFVNNNVFSNLSPGNYTVEVKDAGGCILKYTREIDQASPFIVSAVVTGVTRSGTSDGRIDFNIAGNITFPAEIRINGLLWQTINGRTAALTDQLEGYYYISVTDANGCLDRDTVYLGIDRGDISNEVSGTVFEDANNNGTFDAGENPLADVMVYVLTPSGDEAVRYASSDAQGNYSLSLGRGTWRIYTVAPSYSTQTFPAQPYHEITFTINGQASSGRDFGYYRTPGVLDVAVSITQTGNAVRGGNVQYMVTRWNRGTATASGDVKYKADPLFRHSNYFPAADGINGQEITWNYAGLAPGNFVNVRATGSLDPSGVVNTPLINPAVISPIAGDALPENNNDTSKTVIGAPYDPNMKIAQRLNKTTADTIFETETILYTIYFQNLGNAPAKTVRVADDFDVNFDMKTFEMVAASHEKMAISFRGGASNIASTTPVPATVVWTFSDYNLPPKSADELGSIGFVKFKIKTKPKRLCNTDLPNTMRIYFDFEAPISPQKPALTLVNPKPKGDFTAEPETLKVNELLTVNPKFTRFAEGDGEWNLDGAKEAVPASRGLAPFTTSYATTGEKTLTWRLKNPFCDDVVTRRVVVIDCPVKTPESVEKEMCSNEPIDLGTEQVILATQYPQWEKGEKTLPLKVTKPGTYILSIMDLNSNCPERIVNYTVKEKECTLNVANVFSPNNDGINDFWEIRDPKIERIAVKIYDRWGREVFQSSGNAVRWDGFDAADGVYFYQMEIVLNPGKKTQRAGNITILR